MKEEVKYTFPLPEAHLYLMLTHIVIEQLAPIWVILSLFRRLFLHPIVLSDTHFIHMHFLSHTLTTHYRRPLAYFSNQQKSSGIEHCRVYIILITHFYHNVRIIETALNPPDSHKKMSITRLRETIGHHRTSPVRLHFPISRKLPPPPKKKSKRYTFSFSFLVPSFIDNTTTINTSTKPILHSTPFTLSPNFCLHKPMAVLNTIEIR